MQQTVNGVSFYTPAFVPDASAISHTLQALPVKLTKAGDHFFDFLTGDAYNPADPTLTDAQFRLTAPDGTIYKVHAANGITEQQFTDGKKFILSDSGITAVGTGESIQFIWNSSPLTPNASRLTSVTGPDGHRVVYSYDQQSNLVSARDLITGDTSRYGYTAGPLSRLSLMTATGQTGQVIQYPATPGTPSTPQIFPVKADLGAALTYLATPFTSTLTPGATDQLVFSVRQSELASLDVSRFTSNVSRSLYLGVIVEANTGSTVLPGLPIIDGLTALASNVIGNKAFSLFRIEKDGLQLLKVAGANEATSGAYSVKVFIAGDANRDTKVDGTDSSLIEAALGATAGAIGYTPLADFDQNGRIDTADLHLYRQNLGFIPNQAPVVHPVTPVQTHIDWKCSSRSCPSSATKRTIPFSIALNGASASASVTAKCKHLHYSNVGENTSWG